jgi:hypothetical protein
MAMHVLLLYPVIVVSTTSRKHSIMPPLPPPLQVQAALERVRAGADVMPRAQLERVLVSELGEGWEASVQEFDWTPRAAASIGQVRHPCKMLFTLHLGVILHLTVILLLRVLHCHWIHVMWPSLQRYAT